MAGNNDISETTLRRWRNELLALLAAQALCPDRALRKVVCCGGEVVLVDGCRGKPPLAGKPLTRRRRTNEKDAPTVSGLKSELRLR